MNLSGALQGNDGAGEPGDAGFPDRDQGQRSDQAVIPKTTLILGLAMMLGLGAGAVLAFLADYLDGRIKTLEQAEAISGVPALAAVPLIGARELARLARRGRNELGRYDPKT